MINKRVKLIEVLVNKYNGVPNFTETDAENLIDEALLIHDIDNSADLVILYAQYQAAWKIALNSAHFYKFSDGEESVDKTNIIDNYRKLAKDYKVIYDSERSKIHGNNFMIAPRIDRPNTTPVTGNSGRRTIWRRY